MSSGSLGRLSEGADGGPNGEDENKDGQGAPELDGGKAWALSSLLWLPRRRRRPGLLRFRML